MAVGAAAAAEGADSRDRRTAKRQLAVVDRERGLDKPGDAVELDVLDIVASYPSATTGEPDHLRLGHLAHNGHAVARSVVIDGSTTDRAVDRVAVGERVG